MSNSFVRQISCARVKSGITQNTCNLRQIFVAYSRSLLSSSSVSFPRRVVCSSSIFSQSYAKFEAFICWLCFICLTVCAVDLMLPTIPINAWPWILLSYFFLEMMKSHTASILAEPRWRPIWAISPFSTVDISYLTVHPSKLEANNLLSSSIVIFKFSQAVLTNYLQPPYRLL